MGSAMGKVIFKEGLASEYDLYLFHQGNNFRSYQFLGAHPVTEGEESGVRFSLWAPRAKQVRVVGDFNQWRGGSHQMELLSESGVWSLFIPGIGEGELYKYQIFTETGQKLMKVDPYALAAELRPNTASQVASLSGYQWGDYQWQNSSNANSYQAPMLIYEVHLGSWKQKALGESLSYRELADQLINYVVEMGYTHLEIMPIVEHPYDGSWGYQATGYYAATSRYGKAHDLMYLIDQAHQHGIGVILDWVPGHFCQDDHGLRLYDGTPQFEYEDPLKQVNYGWGTSYFDLGKPEVQSFLISNALFWFEVYHIDGLRVDAVASMLYLDYAKDPGTWRPNQYGGRENIEAINFLRKLNEAVFKYYPNALMIAEESTTWPMVSHPTDVGGLGFNYKWNMGWMNDILRYLEMDPIYRKYHHHLITFSLVYAFSENFILPLSHDEVVHGKRSLLNKMPGDYWQKFANLRAFYGYMMAHPGKKLLFMGGDFGQFIEWKYAESLDWHLLDYSLHAQLHTYFKQLVKFYREESSFWYHDFSWDGFEWIEPNDSSHSIVIFMRKGQEGEFIVVISNFTPVVRYDYRIGVPFPGEYLEVFNSDQEIFGGSGQINNTLQAENVPWHNQTYSLQLKIPPLATIYLKLAKS